VGQLGQQQGQINQQSREIARRMSQQMRMQAGDEGEMRRLADEQRRIREQLSQIVEEEAREQKLLGRLDQTEREMREVEEQLRQGRAGDDLEERQTRILSRLLDAQRSLNRRDFDPQREARRGAAEARTAPGALRPELLRTQDRLRGDLLRAGADRYPAHYRALIEAYLRSLNEGPR
jgi:hypothetical protein